MGNKTRYIYSSPDNQNNDLNGHSNGHSASFPSFTEEDQAFLTANRPAALAVFRAGFKILAIDYALQRMNAGTYGYCRDCETPIGIERLTADPTIYLCKECKYEK